MATRKTAPTKMAEAFVEDVLRAARTMPLDVFLGIDIGKSTGYAFVDMTRRIAVTGQAPADEVPHVLRAAGADVRRAQVFIREMPYTQSMGQMDDGPPVKGKKRGGHITPLSLYRLGVSAGIITRAVVPFIDEAHVFYEPMPSTWRAVLGLNRKKTDSASARENTNNAVHTWAEADTRRLMRTERGTLCYDEANAYAMTMSTVSIIRSIVSGSNQAALRF